MNQLENYTIATQKKVLTVGDCYKIGYYIQGYLPDGMEIEDLHKLREDPKNILVLLIPHKCNYPFSDIGNACYEVCPKVMTKHGTAFIAVNSYEEEIKVEASIRHQPITVTPLVWNTDDSYHTISTQLADKKKAILQYKGERPHFTGSKDEAKRVGNLRRKKHQITKEESMELKTLCEKSETKKYSIFIY